MIRVKAGTVNCLVIPTVRLPWECKEILNPFEVPVSPTVILSLDYLPSYQRVYDQESGTSKGLRISLASSQQVMSDIRWRTTERGTKEYLLRGRPVISWLPPLTTLMGEAVAKRRDP